MHEPDHETVTQRQQAFGYTFEDLRIVMLPMARDGVQPLGSMGTDTPLAVLSNKPQLFYNYFKQLFAQVTNPPIDCIREEIITSGETTIGPERNLLKPEPQNCQQIKLKGPLLSNEEFEKLRHLNSPHFRSITLPILFKAADGGKGLEKAIDELCAKASRAIADGKNFIILSDRGINKDWAAVPALLAVAAVHHHLIRNGTRTRTGLILESGEPREVHHFALLIGYGVGAINPYLAFETLDDMIRQGILTGIDHKHAVKNYLKGASKGVVKTMGKMGISTIQSYRGAQIFEAIGINSTVIDKYFTWTASRIEGVGIEEIARGGSACGTITRSPTVKSTARRSIRAASINGGATASVTCSIPRRSPSFNSRLPHEQLQGVQGVHRTWSTTRRKTLCTLRGLFDLKFAPQPIPMDEVESVESIVKRFKTGAMSYGSISKEAHEALAIAMNRIGGKSNTGEGGEDPERYKLDAQRRSARIPRSNRSPAAGSA